MSNKLLKLGLAAVVIGLLFIILLPTNVFAEDDVFSKEERDYIMSKRVIKAASVDGAAPIQYLDANGEPQGISKLVMEKIALLTGLTFEYKIYATSGEIYTSDADIILGVPPNYAIPGRILSHPYLKSETILYLNSSVKRSDLHNKKYAAVVGGELPAGIKQENAIYYDTREDAIDAVDRGEADYGYGNAYSVAFYTLQNQYKNIVTIPKGMESREYCIAFINEDDLLISIINKSIKQIDENEMTNIILNIAANVQPSISFTMVMNAYGKEIAGVTVVIIAILLSSVIINVKTNKQLRIQNKRYEKLAEISNEHFFEYFTKGNKLQLSNKCIQLFENDDTLKEAIDVLQKALSNREEGEQITKVRLPLPNKEMGTFKIVNLSVNDDNNNLEYIMGKLVDISEETAEKERLLNKAQLDGLTGIYNPSTTKELIINRINNKDNSTIDALIFIDIDYFKDINDNYGHLLGNEVLIHLANGLKQTFRNTDIIGRVGGDEFSIYMKDIPSIDFVKNKCQQISNIYRDTPEDILLSVSIGVALVNEEKDYELIFKKADDALYQAKRNGKSQVVIYGHA